LNNIIIVVIFTWQIQQRNNMYDVLIVDSSSPSRTSFVTSHLTTWFQTQFLVTRLSHFHFMSSTATHTFNLPSGYFFNTPNVRSQWRRVDCDENIKNTIWLPLNCNQKVSASLFTQNLTWVQATWRVHVKEDCQQAKYKATRPGYSIGIHARATSRPTAKLNYITSVTTVRYFGLFLYVYIVWTHLVSAIWISTSWSTYSQSIVGCRHPHWPSSPLWLPDSLACVRGSLPWGMLGCTAQRYERWVPALEYATCRWRSTFWGLWSRVLLIQNQSTEDHFIPVEVANTPLCIHVSETTVCTREPIWLITRPTSAGVVD